MHGLFKNLCVLSLQHQESRHSVVLGFHFSGDGNEDKLRELFPHLYSVNDVSRMSWPGPIHRETFMQLATNITWRGPQDGNIGLKHENA